LKNSVNQNITDRMKKKDDSNMLIQWWEKGT